MHIKSTKKSNDEGIFPRQKENLMQKLTSGKSAHYWIITQFCTTEKYILSLKLKL